MPENGLHDHSVTPATPPTASPPQSGRLALEREIDDLWKQTNSPKIGLFAMRRIYGRLAELRAQIAQLEKQDDGN